MNPSSPIDLAWYAERLQRQRTDLTAQLKQRLTPALAALVLDGQATLDDPDVMRRLAGRDLVRLAEELAVLRSVEAACARLVDGSYGRCLNCGAPIAHERLRVQPTARKCLPCQEAHERHPHHGQRD